MTLHEDSVVEFLSNQKRPYDALSEKDVSSFAREIVKLVDEKDGFPVSPGVWLASPAQMTEGLSSVLMSVLYSGYRAWEVNPQANAFVALRHWESGEVWLEPFLYDTSKRKIHRKSSLGEKPSEVKAGTWHPLVYKVELSKKYAMAISDGGYTLTGLYYDLQSNSADFVYSQSKNYGEHKEVFFPSFYFSKKEGSALTLEISFDDSKSNVDIWKINIIALKVDEKPIITPMEINLTKEKECVTIDLPTNVGKWKEGIYQIYLDGGKEVKGPIDVKISS